MDCGFQHADVIDTLILFLDKPLFTFLITNCLLWFRHYNVANIFAEALLKITQCTVW